MIRATPNSDGGLLITAELDRPPSVYLDNDSILDLSRNERRRSRFLRIFEKKGTLLFSLTNAADLAGPQGRSAQLAERFLDALGPYWIPLEFNPYKVVAREAGRVPFDGTACIAAEMMDAFVRQRIYEFGQSMTTPDLFRLGRVVAWVQEDRKDTLKQLDEIKIGVATLVRTARTEFLAGKAEFEINNPVQPFDENRPAHFVFPELLRIVAKQARSHAWMENDGVDFVHAVVALAYSSFVLLDKQWAQRARALPLPADWVRVYYRNELDDFLDVFEHCDVRVRARPSHGGTGVGPS